MCLLCLCIGVVEFHFYIKKEQRQKQHLFSSFWVLMPLFLLYSPCPHFLHQRSTSPLLNARDRHMDSICLAVLSSYTLHVSPVHSEFVFLSPSSEYGVPNNAAIEESKSKRWSNGSTTKDKVRRSDGYGRGFTLRPHCNCGSTAQGSWRGMTASNISF